MAAETDDPRVALNDTDVSVRAAAARDLSREGTLEDLPRLIAAAKEDKSPSIRLCAAAAAADVSLRHARQMSRDDRALLVREVTGADPGNNPSLLMALASVPSRDVIRRLGRILRDPRYDVRQGAVATLRRLAVSGAHTRAGLQADLAREMRAWMSGGKHPPDVVLELVRIAGEAGLKDLSESVTEVGRTAALSEAAAEAIERLELRQCAAQWSGFWVSWGVDVLQPEPGAPADWVAVRGNEAVLPNGDRVGLELGPQGAQLGDDAVRLVWAQRPGEGELLPAFQRNGVAYWRMDTGSLVSTTTEMLPRVESVQEAAGVVAEALATVEGVTAKRLRSRLLWRAGTASEALPLLTQLTDAGKPKAEDLWVLAHVHEELGESDAARVAIAKAISLAPKKCAWRDDAESLAARLSA